MSTNTLAVPNGNEREHDVMAQVITQGNTKQLSAEEKWIYYKIRCEAVGADPMTQPFDFIPGQGGRETLYPNKSLAEQLRRRDGVSVEIVEQYTTEEGVRIVRAAATARDGRRDEDIAAISVKGLQGEALANALMKCITKAKRRATLSLCGLGAMMHLADEDGWDDEPPSLDRSTAMRHLHAAGAKRGLGHDALRAIAQAHHPRLESLAELDDQGLRVVADAVQSADDRTLQNWQAAGGEAVETTGRVVDVDTGEIMEPPADPKATAMSRYHAAGRAAGLGDTALHLLAIGMFPKRANNQTTTSRNQLTAAELSDLAGWIEEHQQDGSPWLDYVEAIGAATSLTRLEEISAELRQAGIAEDWLRVMWKARAHELANQEQRAQPVSVEAAMQHLAAQVAVPAGEAGNDKWSR